MQRYNPLEAPDGQEWLALDEQERIDLVRAYHRKASIRLPNAKVHAIVNGCDELRINGAIGRRQRKEAVNGLQGWSDATFMGSERWIAWGLVELIDGGGL